ncbi:hypothetical protein [uncultured Fretibacterium sp.]|uniref:hypothetical protein n=1 Tax=uncultured Fretibacterium sp. TaxID=1678694 RepID=UPI0026371592|nr:hypothetical protein [uncultured Fretibacterium sp.]
MIHILQVKFERLEASAAPAAGAEGWLLDLDEPAAADVLHADPRLPDILGLALYGAAWPKALEVEEPRRVEVLFEAEGTRRRVARELRPEGPAPARAEGGNGGVEELISLPPEAFLHQVLLAQRGFASLLIAPSLDRAALLDALAGPALRGEVSALSWRRYQGLRRRGAFPVAQTEAAGDELARTLDEIAGVEALLDRRAREVHCGFLARRAAEEVRELDRRRGEWEREKALFLPMEQRLDRGRRALELGDEYEGIRRMRQEQDQARTAQLALKESMTAARTELQNAEEAFTVKESEFRDRLIAQKRLAETALAVQDLDRQLRDRQEAVQRLEAQLSQAGQELRERTARLEDEQLAVEKLSLSLREVRKSLQLHASDERLATGLQGIQKCFGLYREALERRSASRESYALAIRKKQEAQTALNDRQAMFSDVAHRFTVVEKNYQRAQTFYESSLKGKSLEEWRSSCDELVRRLEELERLTSRFREEQELQERLQGLQARRLRMQQETRELNIQDATQSGKAEALQEEVQKLEGRVRLLQGMEELSGMRELLEDGVPCPLCGAMTHPYASGTAVPEAEEVNRQLNDAMKAMEELRAELKGRQSRAGWLVGEISSIGRGEEDLRQDLERLGDIITQSVAALGLKFNVGVPPLEELDRVRQKVRDQLQRARNALEAASAAQRDRDAAADELARIRESREELTRYHQEALFQLQSERSEEARVEGESRSQEEAFNALRRELIAQLSPYGYKSIPDENPESVVRALEVRAAEWRENAARRDELERQFSAAQASATAVRKEQDAFKLRKEELMRELRTVEAERDSLQQKRIILFNSKDPASEKERMERDVEDLRQQLEARRLARSEGSARLQEIMASLHELETRLATLREELQRGEIAFGKHMLSVGFKNENDYISACLSGEERRDLQRRLGELAQTDLDLTAARENAKSLQMELQSRLGGLRTSLGDGDALLRRLLDLNRRAGELCLALPRDSAAVKQYREFCEGLHPRLWDLELSLSGGDVRRELSELVFSALLECANVRRAEAGMRALTPGEAPLTLGPGAEGAALSLAWGLSDLFTAGEQVDLRLLDAELEGASPDGLQRLNGLISALRRDEERVLLCPDVGTRWTQGD